eukprot:jgi/Psemu1/317853/estExt_fgenesh1_pm.C_300021
MHSSVGLERTQSRGWSGRSGKAVQQSTDGREMAFDADADADADDNVDELPAAATTGNIASHLAPIPTERDLAMVGGVFALTSAKRDKLGELKNKLGETNHSLDELATDEELLDLYLADGIKLVASVTDSGADVTVDANKDVDVDVNVDAPTVAGQFSEWLAGQHDPSSNDGDEVTRTALEIKLEHIAAKIDVLLGDVPPSGCLVSIRDYLDPAVVRDELKEAGQDEDLFVNTADASAEPDSFRDAVTRYRLLLAKSAIEKLSESWTVLTTVSDGDIDRAAAEGIAVEPQRETVSLNKVLAFLKATVSGSCSDRVTAAWDLLDVDGDGSLDEAEMNHVVHLCLDIEAKALQELFKEAVDAVPVRAPLAAIGSDDGDDEATSAAAADTTAPVGWRQKRKEKKAKKKLLQMFEKTCKRHFDVEVEIHHRLRCVYAWANKADQGNRLKSVLVDEQLQAGWGGRKRYVELSPKISEAEFREVQSIHFTHLDKLGTELITSFREDLWVLQGKGRERKELLRNSFLFLAGVSAVDAVILML